MRPRTAWRQSMAAMGAAMLLLLGFPAVGTASAPPAWIGGADRYETSAVMARQAFPNGARTVFLARGDDFPDALAAGAAAAAAAGAGGAPVLLTRRDRVPTVVRDEIARLRPHTVVILGGHSAISASAEIEVAGIATTTRLQGANRYATAVRVAEWAFDKGPQVERPRTVHLASGVAFPDALGGGVAAALSAGSIFPGGGPLLLTSPGALSPETAAYLKRLRPDTIVLLGGPAAITSEVAAQARSIAPVTRVAGSDRYATSAVISAQTFMSAGTVFLAAGTTFPDALSGTPLAVAHRGPILLTHGSTLHPAVCAEVKRLQPTRILALGGPRAVSPAVRAAAQECAQILPGPPSLTPVPGPTTGPVPPRAAPGS